MNIFTFSLKSMKKRCALLLFLCLQNILLVIALVNLFSMTFIKQINKSSVKSSINPEKAISISIETNELMQNSNKKFKEKQTFYNYIKNHSNTDKWLKCTKIDSDCINSRVNYNQAFNIKSSHSPRNINEINRYIVNLDYLNLLSDYIDSGRNYTKTEIDNQTKFIVDFLKGKYNNHNKPNPIIPVLAGNSFKKIHKLNDIIHAQDNGKGILVNYKIIGFLKKDIFALHENFAYYTLKNRTFNHCLIELDPSIDYNKLNMSIEDKSNNFTYMINNSVILLKHDDNNKTKNKFTNKGNQFNLQTTIKSYNDDIDELLKQIKPRILYETCKDFIILTFCIIGLLGSIIALINDNKKELGILISIGLNTNRLTFIYSIQYLFILILSYILGILISFKLNATVFASGLNNTFTIFNIGTTLLVLLVIFLLIVVSIYIMFKKTKPIDMIGGFRE